MSLAKEGGGKAEQVRREMVNSSSEIELALLGK